MEKNKIFIVRITFYDEYGEIETKTIEAVAKDSSYMLQAAKFMYPEAIAVEIYEKVLERVDYQ